MEHITSTPFGTMPDGTPVRCITLRNGQMSCEILTYGGAIRSLTVPDQAGQAVDVVLGYETLEEYLAQDKYIGALIGRYANRIKGGSFPLQGREYPIQTNDNGINHLHGGSVGFDKQVWEIVHGAENTVTLCLNSPDGQEGYPGNLSVRVTYRLEHSGLTIDYEAQSDADTLCNLTNHAYFNLSGYDSGPIANQQIQIFASAYTPTDAGSIPTGELAPVEGTPMDLRALQPIGAHWDDPFAQLTLAGGYDHNWVLDDAGAGLHLAAKAVSPETGISMEVLTTLPGIQFYSGNYLDGVVPGKAGSPNARRWGFCLETQYFPDSPHHPSFPSAVLPKDAVYRQTTVYRFGLDTSFFPPTQKEGVCL